MVDPKLSDILGILPFPALAITAEEKISFMNVMAMQLFGQGLIGRHYVNALRYPNLLDAIEATLKDKELRNARYQGTIAQREVVYEVSCNFDLADHLILIFDDKSGIEDANQMRRDFIANVSHELKTPLTALIGFVETLQATAKDDPNAREQFLAIMKSEAQRMDRLIADLLSLSRVEASERVRPTQRVNLKDAVTESIEALVPLIEKSNPKLVIELSKSPIEVMGEGDQLRQVFINLLENAIKYGKNGGVITISLSEPYYEPKLRKDAVSLSVKDEGIGIDPIHIPRLTERFYRVDTHRSREMGGTGLGLAIVKHIMNRHRGRFMIDSTLGSGTEVKLLLPVY
mgnify:CR=1 FL=1